MTKFSIVIPTYNRKEFIKLAVQSALEQDYKDFEVIVVDDGSTDGTEQIFKSWDDPRLSYFKKVNGERAAARNYGAEKSTGDYINFFDSDDLLYPNHLVTAKKFLFERENPEVFHLGYDIKTADGELMRVVDRIPDPVNGHLINGNHLSCNGVFIRKDIAKGFPFNEDRALSASEDYELWLRLASIVPFHSCKEVTSTVINHGARSVIRVNEEKLIARIETLIDSLKRQTDFLKRYSKRLPEFYRSLDLYIALHLAMNKNRSQSLKYLGRSLQYGVQTLSDRRFYAVIKNLLK